MLVFFKDELWLRTWNMTGDLVATEKKKISGTVLVSSK